LCAWRVLLSTFPIWQARAGGEFHPGGQLTLAACNATDPAQRWSLSADGALVSAASGRCLDSARAGGGDTNVWARPLTGGRAAAVFLNNNAGDKDVPCDYACFAGMGFKSGQLLKPINIWTLQEATEFTVGPGMPPFTPRNVPSDGGSAMFRFDPV